MQALIPDLLFNALSIVSFLHTYSVLHIMDTKASSFASPSASARNGDLPDVESAVNNANLLTITFTILAILIAYDQSMLSTL